MTDPSLTAADRAAAQVEQIVSAAQKAADQILAEARVERKEIRDSAREDVEAELERARKEAILLAQEAKRDAEEVLSEARRDAADLRSQTNSAVEGRVAAAEKAAADVLAEARALTGGLRQLGRSLEEQADRILRDVQAAHKRMQADLRVGPALANAGSDDEPARSRPRPAERPSRIDRDRREPSERERREPSAPRPAGDGSPRSPFDELEVPSWVARDA